MNGMENYDTDSSSSDDDWGDWIDDDDDFDEVAIILAQWEEKLDSQRPRPGSQPGRLRIPRDRVGGHNKLWNDYFANPPVYPPYLFRRQYRMSSDLFLRVTNAVEANCKYFVCRRNAAGELGFSALQKVTAAIRVLAYGIPADIADEYLRIGEDTTLKSVRKFTSTMIKVFGAEYLRAPNEEDTARLLAMAEARGFPGMLGCIDCMHWKWKNCPVAWHGQYTGHCHDPTIILEAVASEDLWIWHSYFGMPGSHNDINVLQRSPLFARLANGDAPACNFTVNGHEYDQGYYLADGIYPAWSTFVKTIQNPVGNKQMQFAKAQMAVRKDIERTFGVLQSQFAIVCGPARFWDKKTLGNIMTCCVILHNMIIEDERDQDVDYVYDFMGPTVHPYRNPDHLQRFLEAYRKIEDRASHLQLRDDLVEHQWSFYGKAT